MVEEYLQKLYQELYEQKLNLEQEKQRKEVQLKYNIKFVKVLEESIDEDFEAFSPRKVNEESHKKIVLLMEEQKELKGEIDSLQEKMDDLSNRMEELEEVIENVRQNQGYMDVPVNQDENVSEDNKNENKKEEIKLSKETRKVIPGLKNISHKIEMCGKLLDVDTVRCKLELNGIERNLSKLISYLEKMEVL